MKALICACLACASGGAAAQSLLSDAVRTRVDVVMLGDSNQLFGGRGYEHGWAKDLSDRFGLYATGIHWMGENTGSGSGAGYFCNTIANQSAGIFGYGESSPPPDPLNPFAADLRPCNVLMLSADYSLTSVGFTLHADGPYFVPGERLEFRGLFRTLGAGVFLQPLVRLGEPPYTVLVQNPTIGHAPGVRETTLTLTATNHLSLDFKFGNLTIAPYETYFAHATNMDRPTGAAVSTLYAYGGQSARDAAGSIGAVSDELLSTYFGTLRARQQTDSPRILVRIAFGLNDRNEITPSIREGFVGDSPEAFVDNVGFIIDRILSIAAANAWAPNGFEFVVTMPAPVATPNDPRLSAYEAAAQSLASTGNVRLIRFSSLFTEGEMAEAGYFASPTDRNHLSLAGYEALSSAEIGAILAGPCPSDINRDGGTDGDDVIAYCWTWDAGEMTADFNIDGGVDGDDVISFFAHWDSGC